ncbi:MAG: bud neck involved protein [Bogoriella megaspora]|nr:MAG: bud neck involved protein [Bogoriella megaspora]
MHPRPSSADAFQQTRQSHNSRSVFSNQNGGTGYRGTSSPPVAPYAFQHTPQLRTEARTSSAPNVSSQGSQGLPPPGLRVSHAATSSTSSQSSSSSSSNPSFSQDDSALSVHTQKLNDTNSRTATAVTMSASAPDLTLIADGKSPKSTPDRYRRNHQRAETNSPTQQNKGSAPPSGSGMANVSHLLPNDITSSQPRPRSGSLGSGRSADDSVVPRQGGSELAKRYRRRSLANVDTSAWANPPTPPSEPASVRQPQARETSQLAPRPTSFHQRTSSKDNIPRENVPPVLTDFNPALLRRESQPTAVSTPSQPNPSIARAEPKPVNIPARGSSDATKRVLNPSPLSQPATTSDEPPRNPNAGKSWAQVAAKQPTPAPAPRAPQPTAAQSLAALNERDPRQGVKSRLRRAFSFGSAQELNRVENKAAPAPVKKLTKPEPTQTPEDAEEAEHAAIAARQEAAGIGAGIYSGQGGFSGSTDNLSISSTASSASIMLRKMGKGAKKGARSIKGLFRPKSVVGVPAADGPVQPSTAQVSMVTVEAEREKVNVNVHPGDQAGGGTGFPKLERNSIDAASAAVSDNPPSLSDANSSDMPRKSIVGGERDRAEVHAALSLRKGILKRQGTNSASSSPVVLPADQKIGEFQGLPQIPRISDSPASSVASTPVDERRLGTPTQQTSDYFTQKLSSNTHLQPGMSPRNISFSPRIQFHEVYAAQEYDRRGEIATCNRLTPVLAQQIKEELNSFKMEMEVHEMSKPHTHFF